MSAALDASTRWEIRRQAWSLGVAVIPFGIAFGLACADAGLSTAEAMGFSMLMFTGGSQFAAVQVLGDGGSAWSAIVAAVLLATRSLAYGVVMAPALTGSRWWRALVSMWMIDETMAVGSARPNRREQRFGYLATGVAIYVCWNVSTLAGALLVSEAGDFVTKLGLDATIPAAFLALLWPRLSDPAQRPVALGGAVIALALRPFVSFGVTIIAAAGALVLARRRPARDGQTVRADESVAGESAAGER